jgi:predicted nucleotidyltransferase
MAIECSYNDKNQDFSKLESETLIDLLVELNNVQNKTSLSKFEIFRIECKLTDILKKLLDICNKNVFSSFKLELVMADDK